MTHPFIPPSFARLSRWQRREQAILKLGRLPVVSGTELEARGDTLGEQTRAAEHCADAKSDEDSKGEGHLPSPETALGDALGEESVASPRVGAPGLAGGRSDGDGG